jgi:hypothetical protein
MPNDEQEIPSILEEGSEDLGEGATPAKARWIRRAMRVVPGTGKTEHLVYRFSAYNNALFREPFTTERSSESEAREEHVKTRELITEKLASLAEKKDILHAKEEIIQSLTERLRGLQMRLDESTSELVKSRELEACANLLCDKIKRENEGTQELMRREVADLRNYLSKFAPARRFFKVTFGFFLFFVVTLLLYMSLGIKIVEPFWGAIGIGLTLAILVVVYFGMEDTRKNSEMNSTTRQ